MDELSRASHITRLAQDIIDDPANMQKAVARAHAIQAAAEAIDDVEHGKVREVLNMRSFAAGPQAAAEEVSEKMAGSDNKEAPKPENKKAAKK